MTFDNFLEKLNKLDKKLWVDTAHRVYPYSKEFCGSGLYYGQDRKDRGVPDSLTSSIMSADKVQKFLMTGYIMGVPHNYVSECTIIGIDGRKLADYGYPVGNMLGQSGKFFDSDFIEQIRAEQPDAIDEKILSKGYRAIASEICFYFPKLTRKARELFRCEIEPGRNVFPKRYLDFSVASPNSRILD